MTSIDIYEAHKILLEIAKAFADICEKNSISYYMLGGTMLGAIRHKGFIPWDDDMDFGVARQDYTKLINCLENQLYYPYRCCTYMNGLSNTVILKIDDCRTIINDNHVSDNRANPLGLNIDIFPLDYCAPSNMFFLKQQCLTYIYRAKYANNPHWSKLRLLANKIIDLIIPWTYKEINERKEHLLTNLRPCSYLANVFGAWGKKECIPIEWYGKGTKYAFEDTEFCGLLEYDKYLHQLYGDYMVPPKGDLHIHLDGIYWKD